MYLEILTRCPDEMLLIKSVLLQRTGCGEKGTEYHTQKLCQHHTDGEEVSNIFAISLHFEHYT